MTVPFALRPLPERGGACPRDGEAFAITALRFGGWRSLLEGRCPSCGHRYVQDLPAAHGLVYPSTLDLDTGETHGQWFETELREHWMAPDDAPVALEVDIRRGAPDPVLVDCLDPVYGHALLKLLGAQPYLERGVVALVPRSLAPLVPDAAAEAWVLDAPLDRLRARLTAVESRVDEELDRLGRCAYAPVPAHPHPETFSLETFTGPLEPLRIGTPSVLLSLRPDRLWGRSPRDQRRRYGRLVAELRGRFPDLGAAAIGVVPAGAVPDGCEDLTDERPDGATERRWLAACAGADLLVGVHGSNLLLPSGLAGATVELLPRDRYGNHLQATLVAEPDPLAALYLHRVVHGDADLRDVTPARVADVAASTLGGAAHFLERQLGPLAGQARPPAVSRAPIGAPPAPRWQSAPDR